MGGNLRDAGHARKKRQRRKRNERLRKERKNGEWMHLTVSIDGEAKELWVKSNQSDDAVRLYAQDFLAKDYVRALTAETRWRELREDMENKNWISGVRKSLPEIDDGGT